MGMTSTKYGGIERFNKELVDKDKSDDFVFVYVEKPECDDYIKDMTTDNSQIKEISNKSIISYCISVVILILRFRPHIIHFHFGNEKLLLAPFVRIFFPWIRQITTFHSECVLHSQKAKIMYRLYCKCQSKIIAVSKGVQKEVAAFYDSKKLITSYLGVKCDVSKTKDKARQILGIPKNCIVLTTIGFDVTIKGFDVLADAVESLVKKTTPPLFIVNVVGLNSVRSAKFLDIVRSKNLESYFVSMGIRNDIDMILSATDIYLQPSRTEAISLTIMEALHHGLPVVASNVGGISEVVLDGQNGTLVEACDAEGLSIAISDLLQSPEKREIFGENSKKHSLNFTVERGVDNLIGIYKKTK
uniref:glycosyltransferase family 4 protein n=1 Tax=Candidatus Limisoma sp. TaxID=3076476 RepID=UPI0040257B59